MSLPILAESDQAEFNADMAELRKLTDDVVTQADRYATPAWPGWNVPTILPRPSAVFPLLGPWPDDHAADLIAAWNAEVSA